VKRKLGLGLVIGLLGAFTAFAVALAAGTTVTNGSFETGTTGWNNPAAVDDVCGGWQAADGACSVDMGGSPSRGQLTQDLSTVGGTAYTVSFQLSGNPNCTQTSASFGGTVEGAVKTLIVSATGAASATYSFDTTNTWYGGMGWTPETYTFTATGAVTTLSFQNGISQFCGAAIDAVTISGGSTTGNVPTTADQCKKDGWQTLTDANGTSFKNQGDCVSYVATKGSNLAAGSR
jgi:hypothetical protein